MAPRPEVGPARRGGFQLLWGAARRGGRGRKPALNLELVIRAATQVVEADGLRALTMARVAAQLDVTTMALYRHVSRKEALIDIVIDAAFGIPPPPGRGDWHGEVTTWARACVAMFMARPWLLELVTRTAPIGPNWLAWLNALLRALEGSGLAPQEVIAAATLIDGHARASAEAALAAKSPWAEKFGQVLQTVAGDPRYQAIGALLVKGGFAPPATDAPGLFEFGLERILAGLDAHVAARKSRR